MAAVAVAPADAGCQSLESAPGPRSRADRRSAVALFALAAAVYMLVSGGHTYSSDEEGLFFTTKALVERRSPVVEATPDNAGVLPLRTGRGGAPVTVGGFAQSVFAAPLYLAGSIAGKGINGGQYGDFPERLFVGWFNPIVTAAGVALMFALARRLDADRRWAVVLALAYGFGTFAFPHAKTFFSEPLATTLSLAAAYGVVAAGIARRPKPLLGAGLAFGLALNARASVGLFAIGFALYLLWRFGNAGALGARLRSIVAAATLFGIGMALPVGLLLLTNWWRFGSVTDMGYQSVPLKYPLQEGLYGLFLSPGKSMFLYAPVAAVGVVAALVATRRRAESLLLLGLGAMNALLFARFVQWHGDHSFGPRYLIMTLPFWIAPIAPLLGRHIWQRALVVSSVGGLAVASLGVVMYFNQYFHIADHTIPWTFADDGPTYWRKLHYDPYWSPILGHARAVPDVVRNSLARVDGEDDDMQEWPGTTVEKYGWHFAPPQLDSWVYWTLAKSGPRRFLVLVPALVALAGIAGRRVVTDLRRPPA